MKKKVLLIEDNPDVRENTAEILEDARKVLNLQGLCKDKGEGPEKENGVRCIGGYPVAYYGL